MKYFKTFELANLDDKIFIDSENIEHDQHHRNIDDAYCGYEKALKIFSYNNVNIEQAKGDVSGDDFKGFDADLEISMSNGIFITYQHDRHLGKFFAQTKNDTEIYSTSFNLAELENGYAPVLISLIKKVLDFNF